MSEFAMSIQGAAEIYIPMDRRQALARGETLPDRLTGTALFADVSGFTPLTDALTKTLGARRGAEELTRFLDAVYDALITQVDRWHGGVIGFSGDAITCWFDDEAGDSPLGALRATACAVAMQDAMRQFDAVPVPDGTRLSLTVKTSCASGTVRRFTVGDPNAHLLDAIAGETLQRMAHGEHIAEKGENILDAATVERLGERAIIREWRAGDDPGERFAVLDGLTEAFPPDPFPVCPPLPEATLRQWLIPQVYQRLEAGLGDFLTELRPCVALFLRFSGIDYDADPDAPRKLADYVQWIQTILDTYDGLLVDITIGDKGSYIYCAFGAPTAHEDDAWRAVSTGLALCRPPFDYLDPVQIGISMGTMRTGSCGGATRKTYAILGNEVNLAARLMANCEPNTVLVSRPVQVATSARFEWEDLLPIRVKGNPQPVQIARPIRPASGLDHFAEFKGTLIGRDDALQRLIDFIAPIFAGQFAGMLTVHSDPGMGKSRLIHELHKRIEGDGRPHRWFTLRAQGGLSQSLFAFKSFLKSYFGIVGAEDDDRAQLNMALDALIDALKKSGKPTEELCETLDKRRVFLGWLAGLSWAGSANERLDPKLRYEIALNVLKALFVAEATLQPTVLHLEDAHQLDPDSAAFIAQLTLGLAGVRLALLVTARYDDEGTALLLDCAPDTPEDSIDLGGLSGDDLRALSRQILGDPISDDLAYFLREHTQGNPFFIEQLLLDLYERGLIIEAESQLTVALDSLPELPSGINAVLVARLDRLDAHVKAVVQVASIIGHEFELRVLNHLLASDDRLMEKVQRAQIETIWDARTEAAYLFRHALMSDAAYGIQLYEQRKHWHAQTAVAIESLFPDSLSARATSLTYHFRRAELPDRERHYSRVAGEQAAALFASSEAVYYLSRALELTPESDAQSRYELLIVREKVLDRMGDRLRQSADLNALTALAERLDTDRRRAEVALRRAEFAEVTGNYAEALTAASIAIQLGAQNRAPYDEAFGRYLAGRALWRQGRLDEAQAEIDHALTLAKITDAPDIHARAVLILGVLALARNDYPAARAHFEQAATLRRAQNDPAGEGTALLNLGIVHQYLNDLPTAATYYDMTYRLAREVGDRRSEGIALGNLGNISQGTGHFADAMRYFERALQINISIGNRRSETLNNLYVARCAMLIGDNATAEQRLDAGLQIARAMNDRVNESYLLSTRAILLERLGRPEQAIQEADALLTLALSIKNRAGEAAAHMAFGVALAALRRPHDAIPHYQQATAIRREIGGLIYESLAGEALLWLDQGDVARASSLVAELVQPLIETIFDELDEPARVFLSVYRVLRATNDPRADQVRQAGQLRLHKWIDALSEPGRALILSGVPANGDLMRLSFVSPSLAGGEGARG